MGRKDGLFSRQIKWNISAFEDGRRGTIEKQLILLEVSISITMVDVCCDQVEQGGGLATRVGTNNSRAQADDSRVGEWR